MNAAGSDAETTTGTDELEPCVLVAGATGYIGRHIVEALHDAGYRVRALVRNRAKLEPVAHLCDEVAVAEATDRASLEGVCDGVDAVVSALGLRTLRRRPSAAEVDLHANQNVLECARAAGVDQFIFIGVLNGKEIMTGVPILRPREQFISELKQSGMTWSVIRPTGAFNDGAEIFRIAQRGWGFMLDGGRHRINLIHPADIAKIAARAISDTQLHGIEYGIGGPDTYTQRELTEIAADVLGRRLRPLHLPGWTVDAVASLLKPFNANGAGFVRFFRHSLSRDMVGEPVGDHHIRDFYRQLAANK